MEDGECYSLMQQREQLYFKSLLALLKEVAFHELYMQNARQQLARDEHYDPRTAFKSLDSFKHARVIAYELHSFFQLHRIESTLQECQSILLSVDKSQGDFDYEAFQDLTLPRDPRLRSQTLTRFDNVQIEVGSYARLVFVRDHSQHVIGLFLEKELNFGRRYLAMRQQFCAKWGADVYTFRQKLFPKGVEQLRFQNFRSLGRQYGSLWNSDEFWGLWRRSKSGRDKGGEDCSGDIWVGCEQMQGLLLVDNFSSKQQYGMERGVAVERAVEKPVVSYRVSHWRQREQEEKERKEREMRTLQEEKAKITQGMKYRFTYPESWNDPCQVRTQLRQRTKDYEAEVDGMGEHELQLAYLRLTSAQPHNHI